ncbi:MAG: AraC family transcriptional regulator [Treponema sp.]|jgi:AraC-like DNA-binding protein|nr:AraC family transcriptional regulator [Treponema sp.]
MLIDRPYNRIPPGCIERFIPSHVLNDAIFKGMGIRAGGLSSARKGFVIRRPRNRGYHILIVTISGGGKFTMEDAASVETGPGDSFFSHDGGQGHIHEPLTSPWVFIWLQFSTGEHWLVPPFGDWGIIPGHSLGGGAEGAAGLSRILESILNEELYLHEEANRIRQLYAELFMISLRQGLHPGGDYHRLRYRNQLNRLWQAAARSPAEPWTLEKMSRFAGLSRARLSRVCRDLYGKAPGEKVKEIRMEHALSLLRHFDCLVSEAAELTGYENMSNFSAAFKKYFGYSPRKARAGGE